MGKGKQKIEDKKQFYKNQAKEAEKFKEVFSGFLITSDTGKEKKAVQEAFNLFNQLIDTLYPTLHEDILKKKVKLDDQNENQDQSKKDCQDLLNDELNELRQPRERIFYNLDTGVKKGLIFIKINPSFRSQVSPYEIADNIMNQIHVQNSVISRFCHKLVPLEIACKAEFTIFEEQMQALFKRHIPTDESITWLLDFKCRYNEKFKQKTFLDYILQNIGKEHSVDYKNPDFTIFIDINKNLMGMSMIKNWQLFNKYSMHKTGTNIKNTINIPKKLESQSQQQEESSDGDQANEDINIF